MRNFLIFLTITLVSAILLYVACENLLQSSLENRLKTVPAELERSGIIAEPISFNKISINSLRSLSIKNFKTRISFANKAMISSNELFNLGIDELLLESEDSTYKKLKLTIKNLSLQGTQDYEVEETTNKNNLSYDSIFFTNISTDFQNENSNPEESTKNLLKKLVDYLNTGKLDIPITYSGHVLVDNKIKLKLSLSEDFYVEKSELEKLTVLNLEPSEIDFFSAHPLRIGTITEIKNLSKEFIKKTNKEADPQAVKDIFYIINLKRRFNKQADQIFASYLDDEKRKYYVEVANEFFNKSISDESLAKIINEQKKNFPVKAKANYTLN